MNLDPDPIKQFGLWYQAALDAGAQQPDAMALATSTRAGRPSNRLVLLKGWSERGFAFYTNLGSRKGQELAANPRAALAIYWREVGRQVRAAGRVSRLSRREAAAYWETRPVESQAAAWVSPQSRVIESREWLETMYSETLERLAAGQIPLPPFWGGFRVRPDWIEFWEHEPNRLHDRLRYTRRRGGWLQEVLGP